jgi:hypothetical protein
MNARGTQIGAQVNRRRPVRVLLQEGTDVSVDLS